jgi:hypothetical protein
LKGCVQEAFIDAEDIAEPAVAALTEDGHAGRCYELSGPRLMTFGDAVLEIARAAGRDTRYVPLTPEVYADEQRAQGVPEEWVRWSVGLYEHVRSGGLASLGDGVRRSLGRAPPKPRLVAHLRPWGQPWRRARPSQSEWSRTPGRAKKYPPPCAPIPSVVRLPVRTGCGVNRVSQHQAGSVHQNGQRMFTTSGGTARGDCSIRYGPST